MLCPSRLVPVTANECDPPASADSTTASTTGVRRQAAFPERPTGAALPDAVCGGPDAAIASIAGRAAEPTLTATRTTNRRRATTTSIARIEPAATPATTRRGGSRRASPTRATHRARSGTTEPTAVLARGGVLADAATPKTGRGGV
jgi:hypothetical protein